MIRLSKSGYGVKFNQLVSNGDFANGTTDWTGKNATISVSDRICTFTATSKWGGLRHNLITITAGHRYIIHCELKATTAGSNLFINLEGNVNLSLSDGYIPLTTEWQIYDYRSIAFSVGGSFYLVFGDKRESDRDSFQVRNVYLTDITQDFGAGYEPTTVAQFRAMYSDDYYAYTTGQWQWSKNYETAYPTPVIENGTTLLPIENHIVGILSSEVGKIEIEGNSYQNGTPTPTSPIPIQSFNGENDTVVISGDNGKQLTLPHTVSLSGTDYSLTLNKVGTYADKLVIDRVNRKVELVRNTGKQNLGLLTWHNGYTVGNSKTYYSFLFYAILNNTLPDLPNTKYPVVAYANRGQDKSLSCEVQSQVCIITDSDYDNATALQTSLNNVFVYYALKSNYITITDITNATYTENGTTHSVSEWLDFTDKFLQIETDGLEPSSFTPTYQSRQTYNFLTRELPAGFVRLDYIESSGTQWIDTGVVSSTSKTFSYKIKVAYTATSNVAQAFGGDNGYNYSIDDNGKFLWSTTPMVLNQIYDIEFYNTITERYGVVDGVKYSTAPYTYSNMKIYAFAKSLSSGEAQRFMFAKLYSCRIYDNGSLVRNFIPCYRYSDGVEGLYDTVGKQFYTNQGTGRFIRGKEIESGNLLDLKNFVRGYPSDTTRNNTTKRTFTENTYVVGLSMNNYFDILNITDYNIDMSTNSITITGAGGYGILYVKKLKRNTTYKIYKSGGGTGFQIATSFYASDGTYLSGGYVQSSGTFTTPDSDFAYSLIGFTTPNTSTTGTFSAISLHEVYN